MLSQGHVGATLYRYPGQVGPRFGKSGSLEENENDAITSQLRLISTSVCFKHPYQTYTKCLRHWYAVSREYGCTLIPLHRPSWHQILIFQVHLRSGNDAIKSCLGLISTSNRFIHPQQTIQRVLVIGMLSQGHVGASLYRYTGQVGHRFWDSGSLVE